MFNVVTKAVLPKASASELLKNEAIGTDLYRVFTEERIIGDVSIWSKMNKRKLKTFDNEAKSIKSKVGDKLVQLKEERTLLSRFLIAARKRPELELEETIGNYEFSVVPKSLFGQDGEPLVCNDKSKVREAIERLIKEKSEEMEIDANDTDDTTEEVIEKPPVVVIIDSMALVKRIKKDDKIETWKV